MTKHNSMTDLALLNLCIREHLNEIAPRVMGVLDPLKVVIENYPGRRIGNAVGDQ